MRGLSNAVDAAVRWVRTTTWQQAVLRLLGAACCAAAFILVDPQISQRTLAFLLLVGVVWACAEPDGSGPLVALVAVALTFAVTPATPAGLPAVVVLATLAHLAWAAGACGPRQSRLSGRAWAHWAVRAGSLLAGSGVLIAALLWLPRVQSMTATVVLAAAATITALGASLWLVANRRERPQARS